MPLANKPERGIYISPHLRNKFKPKQDPPVETIEQSVPSEAPCLPESSMVNNTTTTATEKIIHAWELPDAASEPIDYKSFLKEKGNKKNDKQRGKHKEASQDSNQDKLEMKTLQKVDIKVTLKKDQGEGLGTNQEKGTGQSKPAVNQEKGANQELKANPSKPAVNTHQGSLSKGQAPKKPIEWSALPNSDISWAYDEGDLSDFTLP